MNATDIIITRGIMVCKNLEKEHWLCIRYLYAALSPSARAKLKDVFTDDEIKQLEQFIAENYAAAEKNGYKTETEIRRG